MRLRARQFEFTFPRPALVMGIVNVTPDSFSDGGRFLDPIVAVAHARELIAQGADLVDVGGESTRPGALPVPEEEEKRRVLPVIERLAAETRVPISIDTMKPTVAAAALAAGASVINDVAAAGERRVMWELAAESGAGYVCMHMLGTPQTMQEAPQYQNVAAEVRAFFEERLQSMKREGLPVEQVVLDVGIGFGKTLDHNLRLLRALESFTSLARPLLLGVSRKSFIGRLTAAAVEERLPASLACACWAVRAGVGILRVHDVKETVQAVRMTEAVQGTMQDVVRKDP